MMQFLGRLGSAAAVAALTVGFVAPTAVAGGTTTTYDIDSASSLTVVVNKHRPLDPPSYAPRSLTRIKTEQLRTEAAQAYQQMVKEAKADRVNIVTISGYRSYDHQASLYDSYVQQYGQETADTIAARPGHSEHQTGLAMDVGNSSGACALQDCFEDTPVGAWVAEHADEYGFIIRYPKDEQDVTGYKYEPWHLRYVGPELADEMRLKAEQTAWKGPKLDTDTMEEFFGLAPAPDYLY
ncbi:D-alanyl-D-alanine carboxypeptidase family protein [Kocuria rosea]|uniref:D-alanyl-D-alanine carboxypeptidase family protein n=1 Tax=Kocuria rosea TaxID=1275 RepID=A0A4V6PNH8_KOCRO|nr:D-alanyl-D-alanine carboxypeptidase family protein [Kocuria rosea]